jgi:hypothetical protein
MLRVHEAAWGYTMKFAIAALVACATLSLGACNEAESPDQVQADIAKAIADAKAADTSVSAVAYAAVAQVDGQTRIAMAKCQSLDDDAQHQCKYDATAQPRIVKARASATKKGPVDPG